ncbi:MAG TPA: histidine phosphatase family protein [Luteimonas sp.]|nr:histidine phosphatase family protein [Luteimonas sp.]
MPRGFRILLATFMLALGACASTPVPTAAPVLAFVVVRHAEKATDDARDPSLSEAGKARAEALAGLLRDRDVVAAYATGFRRTRDTAAPTAVAHAVTITPYDAAGPAEAFAARLRREHASGTVLVVGHSNTVPGIVSALCACEVAPIDESDYGNLYEVRIGADGVARLDRQRY